jgi:hypothetical protein
MKRQIVMALTMVFIMLVAGTTFLFVATTPAAALVGALRPGIGVGLPGSGIGVLPGVGAGLPGVGLGGIGGPYSGIGLRPGIGVGGIGIGLRPGIG